MKILVLCQYYYPEPFRISDICESLVEKGHVVTVLTGLPNYPEGRIHEDYRFRNKRYELINGVNVIRSFEIGRGSSSLQLLLNYFSFVASASLKSIFLREKFDVIFVNQLSPVLMGIPAIMYKKIYKKKILLYCLDLWPASLAAGGVNEKSLTYKLLMKVSRWIYNSSDSIAVTSNMFKEYFKDTLDVNKELIYLPQYAEDLFVETDSSGISINDKFNFVFAGNIGEMQSVDTIVRAASELRNHSDIIFHIVGDGSKLEECKLLSEKLQLKNIKYYGRQPVSEMPRYYGLADAMLVTLKNDKTLSYTLPGKVQSYMAARKPLIGAINGETSHVILEAKCGLCCEAEDYRELANLIINFCSSNEKKIMADNSYDFYIKNYSKDRFITMLENELIKLGD